MINKLDENIITALEKISQIHRILLIETGKNEGLSAAQIQIIEYISKNRYELSTVSNIAKEFEVKKSTVSDSVNNLLNKGYLIKIYDQIDKRSFFLKLSDKSINVLLKFETKLKENFKILNSTPENEKELISKFLSEVIKSLYDKNIIQNARLCLTCSNFSRNDSNENPFYCNFAKLSFDYKGINFNCHDYIKAENRD